MPESARRNLNGSKRKNLTRVLALLLAIAGVLMLTRFAIARSLIPDPFNPHSMPRAMGGSIHDYTQSECDQLPAASPQEYSDCIRRLLNRYERDREAQLHRDAPYLVLGIAFVTTSVLNLLAARLRKNK